MSKQISYFIEGGDNVGKTTLIDHITKNFTEDYKKEFTKSIGFFINKYPTKDNTEFMNVINKVLRFCNDWKVLISKDEKYHDLYSKVNNLLINTMIKDMDKSLIDTVPKGKKNSWNYINISDRGPLSTYLYNYKDTDNTMNEIYNFEKFVKEYIISKFDSMKQMLDLMKQIDEYMSNLNIVILNNNLPDIPIISDKQEEIEYKKNFDNNTELQQKINRQISNIVSAIDSEKDINTITYPFKLHYINIYHDNGVRKTTEEVYEEFKKLIFNTIKEENNNE